ncbi:MAG: serine/threonine protein kinase [Myxococcota bacterium]|jgi:serine/threonine protein kinase
MLICTTCATRYAPETAACFSHPAESLQPLGTGDDPRLGTVLDDRYVLLESVGEGGMGTVYRAWQRSTQRVVAVKTVRADQATDAVQERFRREATVTAQLRSPHTVTVFDSGELGDGTLYMVMEYLGGKTLLDVVSQKGPIQLGRLRDLALQLCDSLSEAHHLGLVHRDLKPSNLALTERAGGAQSLVVLDFGIVKLLDALGGDARQLTQEGATLGTLATMAPEQIDGHPVGPPADIYAAGITLFYLATGRLPFEDKTALALMYKHKSIAPPPLPAWLGPSAVVAAWNAVIQRCLRKHPLERFPDGDSLRAAIELLPTLAQHMSAPLRVSTALPRTSPRRRQPAPPGSDPAMLPGVSTAAVHRRLTEQRLAAPDDAVTERGRRASLARIVLVATAAAFGLVILIHGLTGG